MSTKRRNHSAEFKAKVALGAVKGDKTLSALAQQFEVHPNQITQWKQQLLENVNQLFQKGQKRQGTEETVFTDLHAKIGQLTVENDFLAKALGR